MIFHRRDDVPIDQRIALVARWIDGQADCHRATLIVQVTGIARPSPPLFPPPQMIRIFPQHSPSSMRAASSTTPSGIFHQHDAGNVVFVQCSPVDSDLRAREIHFVVFRHLSARNDFFLYTSVVCLSF